MANFSGSGHPVFRASSAFKRGTLRSEGGGKKSIIHFNGSHENIELLLRTVISAKQLSVYGAIADLFNEVPKDLRALEKPAAPDHFEKMNIPSDLSIEDKNHCTATEKPGARIRAKIRRLVRRPGIIQTVFWCGFEAYRNRTTLQYSWYRRWSADATFMPRIHDASQWKRDSYKRVDSQEYEDRHSLEHESLLSWWSIQNRRSNTISVSRQYRFLGQNREWRW